MLLKVENRENEGECKYFWFLLNFYRNFGWSFKKFRLKIDNLIVLDKLVGFSRI